MDILLKLPSTNLANKVIKYLPPKLPKQLYANYICMQSSHYKIPWYILPIKLRQQYSFVAHLDELIWGNLDGFIDIHHNPNYGTIIYLEWDSDYVCLLNSIYSYCRTYDVDHEVIMLNPTEYRNLESKFNVNLDACIFHARKIGGRTFIIIGGEY